MQNKEIHNALSKYTKSFFPQKCDYCTRVVLSTLSAQHCQRSKMMMKQEDIHYRHCNGLESIFVLSNVRFVVGVSLVELGASVKTVKDALQIAMIGLGGISTKSVASDEPPQLMQYTNLNASSSVVGAATISLYDVSVHINTLKEEKMTLRDLVASNTNKDAPAIGPLQVLITASEANDDVLSSSSECDSTQRVQAVVLNINHALIDAITVKSLLSAFSNGLKTQIGGGSGASVESSSLQHHKFTEWGEAIRSEPLSQIMSKLKDNSLSHQHYLDWGSLAPINISDVIGRGDSNSSEMPTAGTERDCVIQLDPIVCQKGLAAARARGTTWTGVWMSCLARAVAEFYFLASSSSSSAPASTEQSPRKCCVALSVLVDLRRFINEAKLPLLQVQATVVVAMTYEDVVIDESFRDCITKKEKLLDEAVQMQQDMRTRIERGEAHRQALALSASGDNFAKDAAPVAATIELSNHGIYDTPGELEVAQRFDGYEGLSIIVHSESQSGVMKATASPGINVDHIKCRSFMERVKQLILQVADNE